MEKFRTARRSPALGGVVVREKNANNDRRKRVEFTGGVVCGNDENVRGKNLRKKKPKKKCTYIASLRVCRCVRFIPGEEFARTGTRWVRDRSEYCKIEFSRTFLFLITLVHDATQ